MFIKHFFFVVDKNRIYISPKPYMGTGGGIFENEKKNSNTHIHSHNKYLHTFSYEYERIQQQLEVKIKCKKFSILLA